jgi:hypothetical protein
MDDEDEADLVRKHITMRRLTWISSALLIVVGD